MSKSAVYPTFYMDDVMQTLHRQRNGELEIVNLCQAGSSFNPFDYMAVRFTDTALGNHRAYANLQGNLTLRQLICRYYAENFAVVIEPEQVCITAGATEALAIAFGILSEGGGEVILAEAHFPPFRSTAHLFGLQCRLAPTNTRHCLDVTQLPNLITEQTRAIVINSPSNPHGAILSAAELTAIADVGVPVIFDEVYQALSLTETAIPSAIAQCDRHIVINSFSKSLSLAGLRIGYMVVPHTQVAKLLDIKAAMTFSTNALAQTVVEQLLPHWDYLLAAHRQELRQRWRYFEEVVQTMGMKLRGKPQAGLYGLLDLSAYNRCSSQVALDLANHFAVGTAPGIDFYTADPEFLRLNFASAPQHVELGLSRIAAYLKSYQE